MVVVAIGALPAGFSYIVDPSGAGLGNTTALLMHSPFRDFLIPGIVLFVCNGVLNLVAAILVLLKSNYYPQGILVQGSILTGWIVIQMQMLQLFNYYHLTFGLIGIALMVMGWILWRARHGELSPKHS